MTWIYSQSSGFLYDPEGNLVAVGYSGAGEGKNNPDLQHKKNVGPIPRGMWVIGEAYDSENNLGPLAIPLYPHNHDALDRTDFRSHGDSAAHPGEASEGCIVLARHIREMIILSGNRLLRVIQ